MGIDIGSVQTDVPEQTADNGDIYSGGDHSNTHRVSEGMGRNVLCPERWKALRRCANVLSKLTPYAGCPERQTVTVHKNGLVFGTGLSLQQRHQEINGFRPDWAYSLLPSLSKKFDLSRRLKAHISRAETECLLDTGSGVVQKCQQSAITLSFERRTVGLLQDRGHFLHIQVTQRALARPLRRDP